MSHSVVPIQEDFDSQPGVWSNYDAYSTAQKFALPKQKHVDIRVFEADAERAPLEMIHMNSMTMDLLNGQTMLDLTGDVIIRSAEAWSEGVIEPQADRNNWNGLTLECTAGVNVTESVIGG
jgi:hypothetical protein